MLVNTLTCSFFLEKITLTSNQPSQKDILATERSSQGASKVEQHLAQVI